MTTRRLAAILAADVALIRYFIRGSCGWLRFLSFSGPVRAESAADKFEKQADLAVRQTHFTHFLDCGEK
jgi:hypothetical protein